MQNFHQGKPIVHPVPISGELLVCGWIPVSASTMDGSKKKRGALLQMRKDDPESDEEQEGQGIFQKASSEELKGRVIKKAKMPNFMGNISATATAPATAIVPGPVLNES